MTVEHRTISDPEIHEPKGISSATIDTVYVADGAGSGNFNKVTESVLDSSVQSKLNSTQDTVGIALPMSELAGSNYLIASFTGTLEDVNLVFAQNLTVSDPITLTLYVNGVAVGTPVVVNTNQSEGTVLNINTTAQAIASGQTYGVKASSIGVIPSENVAISFVTKG